MLAQAEDQRAVIKPVDRVTSTTINSVHMRILMLGSWVGKDSMKPIIS